MNRKSSSNNNSTPRGGVLRISSDGDNGRSFLSLEFSTPGCFLVRNIWQVFFFLGEGGGWLLDLSKDFFGCSKQVLKLINNS